MPLTEPTRLVLAKTYVGVDDPDAAAYIAAVEAADEAASPGVGALETATKVAIHSFVKGCKADGIWPAIKASCILAGARTLNGALVPLVGAAPTSFNFVAGDYNRETGLAGDGSTKYLNSNRNNNADPQDSQHLAVYVSTGETGATNKGYLAISGTTDGVSHIIATSGSAAFRSRSGSPFGYTGSPTGFIGLSRASSNSFAYRIANSLVSNSTNSVAPVNQSLIVFGRGVANYTNARLAFYSIGEALNLSLLDARVTDLINAIGAAIP